MNLSNVLLVGLYVSFIIIFIYCYWAYKYYKKSSSRIGIIAARKYAVEMVENDPNSKDFSVHKAQVIVSPDGTQATVKFNIFSKSPPMPVGGAIRKYNIVDTEDKCRTTRIIKRIDSESCQFPEFLSESQKSLKCTPWKKGRPDICGGQVPEKDLARCNNQITKGSGCLFL